MEEHLRVYYQESCTFICSDANKLISDLEIENAWIVRNAKEAEWGNYFFDFIKSSFSHMVFEGDMWDVFDQFEESFQVIVAGGGVVWNQQGELLMINRLNKWDLPKGKIEGTEEVALGAVREVEEETGLQDICLSGIIKSTYHVYEQNGEWILKHTEWYEMNAPKQNLVPQTEEDITAAVWVSKSEATDNLKNSYPNIIFLLEKIL